MVVKKGGRTGVLRFSWVGFWASQSWFLFKKTVRAALTLHTDASVTGLGGMISQEAGPDEWILAYLSRTVTAAESSWTSNDLEYFALVWAVEKLHPYLYGKKGTVKTGIMVKSFGHVSEFVCGSIFGGLKS